MKSVSSFRVCALAVGLMLSLFQSGWSENHNDWLRRLNAESGREVKLSKDDVMFQDADKELFPGLIAIGFRRSDGRYTLGRVIWKGKALSPLAGVGAVLKDGDFASLDDEARRDLFLTLLTQIQGKLGVIPYEGEPSQTKGRPVPIVGERGTDGGHRFLVWYSLFPSNREVREWRHVLYFVSPDGSTVKARTLATYHPKAERLKGFPETP